MFKNVHYITAGAGAGKTTRLVEIITELVRGGAEPERMILTTYTKAAATEFREKSKAALPPDKAVKMNAAKMGTVHSIASAYIQRYWYLLGISPAVKPMNKPLSKLLMNRSLEDAVSGKQVAVFNQYAKLFSIKGTDNGINYDFWKDLLRELFNKIRGYRFDKNRLPEFREKTLALLRDAFDTPRNASILEDERMVLEEYLSYRDLVNDKATDAKKEPYKFKADVVQRILDTNPLMFKYEDLKEYAALAAKKWTNCPVIQKKGPDKDKFDPLLKQSHDDTGDAVKRLTQRLVPADASLILDVTTEMFDVLGKWMDKYSEIKDKNGVIDYADMEELFYRLLQEDVVLEDIENSIDYLFVDEFQDSTPIQTQLFDILSNHVKQSWFVGDRKQAIYGFNGSDAGLIGELARVFPDEVDDLSSSTKFKKNDDGNSSQILKTSHRSVPRLVETANKIFVAAFGVDEPGSPLDKIPANQVELNHEEGKKDTDWESLYHINIEGDNATVRADALAAVLCRIIEDDRFKESGYKKDQIAILARKNDNVTRIASALRRKGIRTAAIDPKGFLGTPEVSLILAILSLSAQIDSAKSRAEIRKILSNEDLDHLVNRIKTKKDKLTDFVGLDDFIKGLRTLSVSDRIDEIITRFDLYDLCGLWDSPQARRSNINLLRQAAAEYTDLSTLLCSAADVRGFLAFLKTFEPEPAFDNTAEGIKVLTYHKAKGLQWDIVILCDLDKPKEVKSISGITVVGKRSKPDHLLAIPPLPAQEWVDNSLLACDSAKSLLLEKQAMERGENRRLLYVGFTRAKDIVITAATSDTPGVIDALCPTKENRVDPNDDNHVDIWGVGLPSFRLTTDDPEKVVTDSDEPVRYKNAGFFLREKKTESAGPKYLSPSKYKDKTIQEASKAEPIKDFGERMDIGHKDLSDNEFGDCLHHLFALCEPKRHEENLAVTERTLRAYGITDGNAPEKVVHAIEVFFDWLEKEYAPVEKMDREVPFRYVDDKGHVFSGNMDMIWRTAKGTVLVDYKTFSGKRADLFDPQNDHWAGQYATQLDVYARALESNDECPPLDRILYYPVEGLVVRVFKASGTSVKH